DTSQRSAGFRLFRSQHTCASRRSMHDVPRTSRPDADDMAGKHAVHGVGASMPSASRAFHPNVGQTHRFSTQADELLDMPSISTEPMWRTLDEYSNFDEFQKSLSDEFPPGVAQRPTALDRREFLSLVSASLAFAGLTSCAPTVPQKIVPYV